MTTKARTKQERRTRVDAAPKIPALEILNLSIKDIHTDPGQPRKTFDDLLLSQLSESIREHGVLQPITVRASDGKYIIVMGERRYRASILAGMKTLPCIVRDYHDGDVLEVQIIENLQRKDVEPTEEAEAIAYLSTRYAPSDIAKRLGRTDNFIRQRLKLAGLIDGFKQFVRSGDMTISLGVAVALFEPEEQQMMLEAMGEAFNAHKIDRMVKDQSYDLNKAPFDISDKVLVAKAGACGDCPFNAANQGDLFGHHKMICTKASCYGMKKEKALVNLIARSKKENILLIPEIRRYWLDGENNQAIISKLEIEGFKIYLLDDVDILSNPIEPTLESIKVEYQYYDYTEDDFKSALEEAMDLYHKKLEAFQSAKEHGYGHGIVFHPETYRQKEVFVKIAEAVANEQPVHAVPLADRKMADCTPEEQIIKMNDRETRKNQIEANKQFEEVVRMVWDTDYILLKKTLSVDEMVAIAIALFENHVDHTARRTYFSDFLGNASQMSQVEMVEAFRKNFKKETFYKLMRYILTKQVHFGECNHVNNLTNIAFYKAIQGYFKSDVEAIEKSYDEQRNKREARLKERIALLEMKIHGSGD
ncbi:ParB/RepB/Spo0J family partition protein [Flavobacteriaceae bacterium XHP0103]|uniref:ParB/RepB/Spo0J family partition protein n=1 Tax=Marixanthotalea marina TaxID=2844359 RepID=UPI002989E8A8|nr:ParB/RepB/Spo0J family partition protein [Marixanthotalea marina]MBU3820980.1 ParB/RepB/Spo0J family partition protein [Marixanthotalea marina]